MLRIDNQDISLTRGDTAYLQFIPQVEGENHKRIDYVLNDGDTVIFRLKSTKSIFEKDCVIDLAENTSILVLVPDDTINLDFATYYYEVELVTIYGEHFTFIANKRFTIGKEIEPHG